MLKGSNGSDDAKAAYRPVGILPGGPICCTLEERRWTKYGHILLLAKDDDGRGYSVIAFRGAKAFEDARSLREGDFFTMLFESSREGVPRLASIECE